MSWSFNAIGHAENICKAMDEESARLSGQSKIEFDAVKPHIAALVSENFTKRPGALEPVVEVEASGHGSANADEQIDRTVSVMIRPNYKRLV